MKLQPLLRRMALGAALCLGSLGAAHAQMNYPMGSLQGLATFGAFPNVSINCTDYTLGPGARVISPLNRIIPRDQLNGLQAPVVFQTDAMGNVFRVWLVSDSAASQLELPKAPGQCGLFFSN
ncbi:MAG TPA: hypothetical protein PLD03_00835 [Thiomonas arsenitoxydans]|jgi:hypothetical protein|nr:hypothetical protein [Thiomonas arsenitoxydans]